MAINRRNKIHSKRFSIMDVILFLVLTAFAITIVFPFYTSIIVPEI